MPTAEEARRFLENENSDKRAKLIDELLQRPEFADYLAMKWSDLLRVKAEFPINLWPNASQAYHHWIRTSIRENMPYDQFVRELLTACGSNFRTPQVNFYRALQSKEPSAIASAVALAFMGVPDGQLAQGAVGRHGRLLLPGRVQADGRMEGRSHRLGSSQGEEGCRRPRRVEPVFPDGTPGKLSSDKDPREVFADVADRRQEPLVHSPIL